MESVRTFFVSFEDQRYKTISRIKREAIDSGFFDVVYCGHENTMFESWYLKKYRTRFVDRGFGYWQWKPYIIRRVFDKMEEGDYLVYLDAGCTINKLGRKRFEEYKQILLKESSGMILFRQGLKETSYTKGDLFAYFKSTHNDEYEKHNQTCGGLIIIRKCLDSSKIIDEWFYLAHTQYCLINDSDSVSPNHADFIEHRHDQSLLSMLSVKYHIKELSDKEIYTLDEDWSTMSDYPFWATRKRLCSTSMIKKIIKRIKNLIFF